MTNKEALIAALQVTVPDGSIEKTLIDNDINGDEGYSKTNVKTIDLAAINILQSILSTPDVSEGGYSINYDRDAILKRINYLSEKYDMGGIAKPTVKAVNIW